MSRLNLERMQQLFGIHGVYERVSDIDGVMSTLFDDPIFEFYPHHVRVQGRAAVWEMYARLCNDSASFRDRNSGQKSGLRRSVRHQRFADARMAADTTGKFLPDDESPIFFKLGIDYTPTGGPGARYRMFEIVTFRGDLMIGEGTYTDSDCAVLFNAALGADFFELPGVGRSTDSR